jgi:hypothetical protein
MAQGGSGLRRTVHIRFRLPPGQSDQLLSLMRAGIPFVENFGRAQVRILRNVDDPNAFVQTIEYEIAEAIELNRQSVASDPMVQGYLQGWRSLLMGAVEIDVYQDVTAAAPGA